MNIIIYPGTENLNVNERQFATPLFDYNFTFMKDNDISSLQETYWMTMGFLLTTTLILY